MTEFIFCMDSYLQAGVVVFGTGSVFLVASDANNMNIIPLLVFSCDQSTQARDAKGIVDAGYKIKDIFFQT